MNASPSHKLMAGKKGLIVGVANDKSIAWGIATACAEHGAELALTYQGEALKKRVEPLAQTLGVRHVMPLDLAEPEQLEAAIAHFKDVWGRIDFVVHAVAASDKDELKGAYINTSRHNFLQTMDISCYSFTVLARAVRELMTNGGALLTLTYYGAERVMPHYNVMGVAKAALEASVRYLAVDLGGQNIRVNAISAGPIKTLAASGIGDFRTILKWNELNTPLRRNVRQNEIGSAALYLLSDLAQGVTGEVHHVDCGYHTIGMVSPDATDETAGLLRNLVQK